MKRGFFVAFSLIYILGHSTVLDGMTTKTRQVSQATKPKSHSIQKTIYQTKPHQKTILFDRLKQYYNQAKQRFSRFWYGEKYPQMVLDESTAILNDIHNKKSKALESFNTFLEKKDQKYIDQFLNTLIFSNNEIEFLNAKTFSLFLGLSLGNKSNIKIARKIIFWVQNNITQIFKQNISITDDFFLFSLLEIDYSTGKQLIPVIHDNLDYIKNQPMGQQFLNILKSDHKTVYLAIMQRKQTVKGILQEGTQKSLDELRKNKIRE